MADIDDAKVAETVAFLQKNGAIEQPGQGGKWQRIAKIRSDLREDIDWHGDSKDAWNNVSGSVVFAAKFKGDHKQDILYSWEYAQRWANKQIHDKYGPTDPSRQDADTVFVHAQEWYGYFSHMLSVLHWVADSWSFQDYQVSGTTFTVDKIMLDILTAFMGDDMVSLDAIKGAMGLLDGLGQDDPRMTLWDSHSQSNGLGTFQMGAVTDGGDGLAVMKTGALQMDCTQTDTTCFFFFHYSTSNTTLTKSTQNLIFNRDAYTKKDSSGTSAKDIVEKAVVDSSTDYLARDGGIE